MGNDDDDAGAGQDGISSIRKGMLPTPKVVEAPTIRHKVFDGWLHGPRMSSG
jgi:hypothetical protein